MGQPLSDTETMLWSLGHDPNLANTMGLVAMLDRKPDVDRVRAAIATTVAAVDRLQQRVVTPSLVKPNGAFGGPEWVVDDRFDLDHHFRAIKLGGSRAATDADLRLAAAQFINDPFDLARPLWQFLLIGGLTGGRAALVGKVHHSISDGLGLLRLAGNLLEFEADAAPPEPVDLAIALAESAERQQDQRDHKSGPERVLGWLQQAAQTVVANPVKVVGAGAGVLASAKTMTGQLPKAEASPLWATRSRNRRLEFCAIPLASLRDRAAELDATINDLFVAACAQAAIRYHHDLDTDLARITATVVVSTTPPSPDEELGGAGDNAFIPVAIELPGSASSAEERLEIVKAEVRRRRAMLSEKPEVMSAISALSGLVPSSVAAALAVGQASKVDFATSNIPGPPMPSWVAGRRLTRLYPVGPVAGTAFNVTLLTYHREALLGIHLDPAAVTEPALLARSMTRGFGDFGVSRR